MKSGLARMDGHELEYLLHGEHSGPAIVFFSGLRAPYDSWKSVYEPLSNSHTVLAYNRPGIGRSTKPKVEQDGTRVIADCKRLLESLSLDPPYVLVGHSIGGLFANLMARQSPESVSAVVLVESAYPHEEQRYEGLPRPWILRAFHGVIGLVERIRGNTGQLNEVNFVDRTSSAVESAPPFPPVPVAVVTGEQAMPFVPEEAVRIHQECQTELLNLSPNARQFMAAKSGHVPQLTEPAVVVEAIEWAVRSL